MAGRAGAWMWGWMILGWVLVIAILTAVVIAVVWAARRAGGGSRQADSLLEILKKRYARGEISSEQFGVMKRQLSGE
jgi:putative membrane protein